jgi:putative transposase
MILSSGGTRFQICELREDGSAILEHCETKAKKTTQTQKLVAGLGTAFKILSVDGDESARLSPEEEDVIARIPADMQSPASVKVLLSKLRWISALGAKGVTARTSVEDIELKQLIVRPELPEEILNFEPRTLKEAWVSYDKAGHDPRALLPNFPMRGGPNKPRINPQAEELLQKRIDIERKNKTPYRPLDLKEQHIIDVSAWNADPKNARIEPASEATINRRFHAAFTPYEIAARNKGKTAARRLFRESGVRIGADTPLLVAQFDDTDGEVFLIDDETGLPWGRAFLTLGIDEATGSILGKQISESHRNVWSATSALVNAILPKDMSNPEYANAKNPWYAYGKLGTVQFDNALYNRAANFLDTVVADAMAVPGWSKPKVPTGKSQIENLNGVIKTDFTPTLPGWRGDKRERDGLSSGPTSGVMSLQTYTQLFNAWVCDRYSNRPRQLGLSPRQIWDAHFKGRQPRMPMDTQGFRLIATQRETHSFRDSGGLLRKGLRYKSKMLEELRTRLGPTASVMTRHHPFDLSKIYVFNPELKTFLVVPCVEPDDYVQRLTDKQQSMILKLARDKGKKNPTLTECNEAKQRLREMCEQLRKSKKLRERRQGMQMAEGRPTAGSSSPAASSASKPTMETELEARIRALEEVGLDDNDEGYRDEAEA